MSGHLAQRRNQIGLARPAARAARDPAVRAEHEDGGRAADIKAADEFQVGFGVYLYVRYPVRRSCYLGQQLPGGAAWRAECGGELDERGTRAERLA